MCHCLVLIPSPNLPRNLSFVYQIYNSELYIQYFKTLYNYPVPSVSWDGGIPNLMTSLFPSHLGGMGGPISYNIFGKSDEQWFWLVVKQGDLW